LGSGGVIEGPVDCGGGHFTDKHRRGIRRTRRTRGIRVIQINTGATGGDTGDFDPDLGSGGVTSGGLDPEGKKITSLVGNPEVITRRQHLSGGDEGRGIEGELDLEVGLI
jgi:hypothetical protein